MQDESQPPEGRLDLQEAMRRWLPAEVQAEVEQSQAADFRLVYRIGGDGARIYEIDHSSQHNRALLLRVQAAQAKAHAYFRAMLAAGRLVAWGRFGSPVAPMQPIPADAWRTLDFVHVSAGRASGGGAEVFGLHIAPPLAPAAHASPSAICERPEEQPAAEAPPAPRHAETPRRRGGRGLDADDAPLLDKMKRLLEQGEATSVWDAALTVSEHAAGGGTPDSKTKRLARKYRERFPES